MRIQTGVAILFILSFTGCLSSKRDNPFDPLNRPAVVAEQATFNPQDGSVTLHWQYIGRPLSRFRVIRWDFRNAITNRTEWITHPVSGDPLSGLADVQPGQIYLDQKRLIAGEEYQYEIEAGDAVAVSKSTLVARIHAPGARLQTIGLNLADASAKISWLQLVSAASCEIVRQANDNPSEVIFHTQDPDVTSFTDTGLEGNTLYRYFMRSHLSTGLALESHGLKRALYLQDRTWSIPLQPDDHVRLTTGNALSGDILGLTANSAKIAIQRFGFEGTPGPVQSLSFLDPAQIAPQSISLAMLENGPDAFVAAVQPQTNQVRLAAFFVNGALEIPWPTNPWPLNNPNARTAIAVGPDHYIFVAAENQLRVFNAALSELGAFTLPSTVSSLAVNQDGIWVILPEENRVLRSPRLVTLDQALQPPAWQDVTLPAGARPISLAKDPASGMLVLDPHRVLIFNAQGQPVSTWTGLDNLTFSPDGSGEGLTVIRGGHAYLWDSTGRVAQFKIFHEAHARTYISDDADVPPPEPPPSRGRG